MNDTIIPPLPPAPTASWRDRVKVHPAAELFPMMPDDELLVLGEDIKKNGLRFKLTFRAEHRRIATAAETAHPQPGSQLDVIRQLRAGKLPLLDGRNRLAAMELVGILDDEAFEKIFREAAICWAEDDAEEFVVSANIRRRHLKPGKKRDLIRKLLKAKPERSDRETAKIAKVSPTTVGTVRSAPEETGEVSKLDTRTGSDGVKQPATKPPKPPSKLDQVRALRERQVEQAEARAAPAPEPDRFRVADELQQVLTVLRGDRTRIAQFPVAKRVALARACLSVLDITLDDLRAAGDAP
jgi:hypothetical protein